MKEISIFIICFVILMSSTTIFAIDTSDYEPISPKDYDEFRMTETEEVVEKKIKELEEKGDNRTAEEEGMYYDFKPNSKAIQIIENNPDWSSIIAEAEKLDEEKYPYSYTFLEHFIEAEEEAKEILDETSADEIEEMISEMKKNSYDLNGKEWGLLIYLEQNVGEAVEGESAAIIITKLRKNRG